MLGEDRDGTGPEMPLGSAGWGLRRQSSSQKGHRECRVYPAGQGWVHGVRDGAV